MFTCILQYPETKNTEIINLTVLKMIKLTFYINKNTMRYHLIVLLCKHKRITAIKYQYDPRIHNFGNVGIGGRFYASVARPVTRIIDRIAYKGVNVRKDLLKL